MTAKFKTPTAPATVVPTAADLHITVVAMTIDGDPTNLASELALSKSAILYADRTTLAGPKALTLAQVEWFRSAPREARDHILLRMLEETRDGHNVATLFRAMSAKRNRTSAELITFAGMKRAIRDAGEGMAARVEELLESSGYRQLQVAIDAGVLDLDQMTASPRAVRKEDIAETMSEFIAASVRHDHPEMAPTVARTPTGGEPVLTDVQRFQDLLIRVMDPSARSLAMLDGFTGGLARSLRDIVANVGVTLSAPAEPAVAGRFIGTLDAFPEAPMDEILSARAALAAPLQRFRSAVSTLSKDVASGTLDPTFDRDVDRLYRDRVAPALEELREIEEDLKLRTQLQRGVATSGTSILKATVAIAAVHASTPDVLAQVIAGLAVPVGTILSAVAKDRRALQEKKRANQFLFLYEADRRLAN